MSFGEKSVDNNAATLGILPVQKPHPKIFKTALNKLKIPANKTLHIGDQPLSDLQGAKQVGITPILLDREKTSEIKVFPIINSLIEIETLLNTQ